MIAIDGSYGEGGGQLLRTAVALSALTGRAVRIERIRARRPRPGLAAQHVAAVRAVAALCGGTAQGLAVGSQTLEFQPGRLRGAELDLDVGTAGAVTLVAQAALPVAAHCPAPVRLRLTGGTDVVAAPPADYLAGVFLPLARRAGIRARAAVRRRGYYPRGGGVLEMHADPGPPVALCLDRAPVVDRVQARIHTSLLPGHVAQRMAQTLREALTRIAPLDVATQRIDATGAAGPGGAVVLWAHTDAAPIGAGEVAQRGVPAERVAGVAVAALRADLDAGAAVDVHAADQLLALLALAPGRSRLRVRTISSHIRTTLWLLHSLLGVDHRETACDGAVVLELEGSALRHARYT